MHDESTLEILALLADYGRTVDDADWEAHEALWTEDGHLVVFDQDHAGREAIVSFMQGARRGHHLTGVPALRIEDGRAHARSAYTFFDESTALFNAGTYVDEFVRVDGHWRFARREIRVRMRATR